jgi:hypothetical protein
MHRSWQALAKTRRLHDLSFTDEKELLLQADEEEKSRFTYQSGSYIKMQLPFFIDRNVRTVVYII